MLPRGPKCSCCVGTSQFFEGAEGGCTLREFHFSQRVRDNHSMGDNPMDSLSASFKDAVVSRGSSQSASAKSLAPLHVGEESATNSQLRGRGSGRRRTVAETSQDSASTPMIFSGAPVRDFNGVISWKCLWCGRGFRSESAVIQHITNKAQAGDGIHRLPPNLNDPLIPPMYMQTVEYVGNMQRSNISPDSAIPPSHAGIRRKHKKNGFFPTQPPDNFIVDPNNHRSNQMLVGMQQQRSSTAGVDILPFQRGKTRRGRNFHGNSESLPNQGSFTSPISIGYSYGNPYEVPYPPIMSPRGPDFDALSDSIKDFEFVNRPTLELEEARKELINRLTHTIDELFEGKVKLDLFGSCASNLSSKSSDLDFCLTYRDSAFETSSRDLLERDHLSILSKLDKRLHDQNYGDVTTILSARVPIVKFHDSRTGIECDLAVRAGKHKLKSRLLQLFTTIDHRFRSLILAEKGWSKRRYVGDASKGSLNSFGHTLLMIHYLQAVEPPVLPMILLDQSIDLSDVQWNERSIEGWVSQNKSSLGELFFGYFEYYSTKFDYTRHIVSLHSRDLIEADEPVRRVKFRESHRITFCVEDPVDSSDNVGRNMSIEAANFVCNEFCRAFALLNNGFHFDMICEEPPEVPILHHTSGFTNYTITNPQFSSQGPSYRVSGMSRGRGRSKTVTGREKSGGNVKKGLSSTRDKKILSNGDDDANSLNFDYSDAYQQALTDPRPHFEIYAQSEPEFEHHFYEYSPVLSPRNLNPDVTNNTSS